MASSSTANDELEEKCKLYPSPHEFAFARRWIKLIWQNHTAETGDEEADLTEAETLELALASGKCVLDACAHRSGENVDFTWGRGTLSKAKARAQLLLQRDTPDAIPWKHQLKVEAVHKDRITIASDASFPADLTDGFWRLDLAENLRTLYAEIGAVEQMAKSKAVLSRLLIHALQSEERRVLNSVDVAADVIDRARDFLKGRRANGAQIEACLNTLTHRVSQIQGPPGTGKTYTCAIVMALNTVFLAQEGHPVLPMLVTSQNNDAVDVLLAYLVKAGLKVGRYGNPANVSPNFKKAVEPYAVDALASKQVQEEKPHLDRTAKTFKGAVRSRRQVLWQERPIHVGTLGSLRGASVVNEQHFDFLLIDEAATVHEPAAMIGIGAVEEVKGRCCQVGDHKQLGPMCATDAMAEKGLGKSLFERLTGREWTPTQMLVLQYRFHPHLAVFPSARWYHNRLENAPRTWNLPAVDSLYGWGTQRILFLHTEAPESGERGESKKNPGQGCIIAKMIPMLIRDTRKGAAPLTPTDIGVLTPYSAQRTVLKEKLAKYVADGTMVDSVTKYQGNEKEVIIASMVRSGSGRTPLGFVDRAQRVNVAFTRAKRLLIIVGNWHTCVASDKEGSLSGYLAKLRDWDCVIDADYNRFVPEERADGWCYTEPQAASTSKGDDDEPEGVDALDAESKEQEWMAAYCRVEVPALAAVFLAQAIEHGRVFVLLPVVRVLFDVILALEYKDHKGWARPPREWDEKTWSHLGEIAVPGVAADPYNEIYFAVLEVILASFGKLSHGWKRLVEFILSPAQIESGNLSRKFRERAGDKLEAMLGMTSDHPSAVILRGELTSRYGVTELDFTRARDQLESLITAVYNYYSFSGANRSELLECLYADGRGVRVEEAPDGAPAGSTKVAAKTRAKRSVTPVEPKRQKTLEAAAAQGNGAIRRTDPWAEGAKDVRTTTLAAPWDKVSKDKRVAIAGEMAAERAERGAFSSSTQGLPAGKPCIPSDKPAANRTDNTNVADANASRLVPTSRVRKHNDDEMVANVWSRTGGGKSNRAPQRGVSPSSTHVLPAGASSSGKASVADANAPGRAPTSRPRRPPSLKKDKGDNRFDYKGRDRKNVCDGCERLFEKKKYSQTSPRLPGAFCDHRLREQCIKGGWSWDEKRLAYEKGLIDATWWCVNCYILYEPRYAGMRYDDVLASLPGNEVAYRRERGRG